MDTSTIIAKDIDAAKDKAKYDAAVKRLLANKRILAWILKSCVREFQDFSIEEIARQYIEREPQVSDVPVIPDETNAPGRIRGTGVEDVTITEGTVVFDIQFQVIVPGNGEIITLFVNIEIQNDFYPGYPLIKRALYYCCRMVSSQYGTVFTKSHYEKVRKVYSIWICADPPRNRQNTITRYSITEENIVGSVKEKEENFDLLSAIIICLGGANDNGYEGILKLLDVLLSTDLEPKQKRDILEQEFDIPMTERFERQVEEVCNLSKGVEEIGIQKGIQQGLQQGLEIGIKNLILDNCEMNVQENVIIRKLRTRFGLNLQEATEYFRKYAAYPSRLV